MPGDELAEPNLPGAVIDKPNELPEMQRRARSVRAFRVRQHRVDVGTHLVELDARSALQCLGRSRRVVVVVSHALDCQLDEAVVHRGPREPDLAAEFIDAPGLRRLEKAKLLQRIDRSVQPTMYRCAIVSDAELQQFRRIQRVVRLRRVRAIEADRIVLDRGEVATAKEHVHVQCTAAGLPLGTAQPVFQGEQIVPQYVRRCSPSFSAAFIAHVEASFHDDDERNALCQPTALPEEPLDWLRMQLDTACNQQQWARPPRLRAWLRQLRLEAYTRPCEEVAREGDAIWQAVQARLYAARATGLKRLAELLDTASPRGVASHAVPRVRLGRKVVPVIAVSTAWNGWWRDKLTRGAGRRPTGPVATSRSRRPRDASMTPRHSKPSRFRMVVEGPS